MHGLYIQFIHSMQCLDSFLRFKNVAYDAHLYHITYG